MESVQARSILRRIGWVYVCYHMAMFLVILLFDASWNFGELVVGFFVYPTAVPALVLCGGVHGGGCKSAGGWILQLLVFGLMLSWAILGWRVALSTGWRWGRLHQPHVQ